MGQLEPRKAGIRQDLQLASQHASTQLETTAYGRALPKVKVLHRPRRASKSVARRQMREACINTSTALKMYVENWFDGACGARLSRGSEGLGEGFFHAIKRLQEVGRCWDELPELLDEL